MPQVPCEVQNPFQENFANPGIIICNHQSHLDLLYTLMLSPKIICLTNKTVWNSPFYGWVLRYASYYPINRGIENNIPVLQQAILDGYSILVFPEGTRSPNCEIQRFHQGAFHLAQKLNVDIIPIITHGIGHITPKTELILRKGKVTVKILERIRPDNQQYRKDKENYKVAKLFRQLYKEEYKKLTLEKETADYYRDLVLHNYFYKGVIVERHARRILSKDSVWMKKIEQLPDEGTHYVTDCEYGVYTLLAALVKKNLTIIASDPDSEKLALARHCPSVPSNLIYVNQ
jgi:1-acyl-sn-glycerol-3-phosphate acyltransferase